MHGQKFVWVISTIGTTNIPCFIKIREVTLQFLVDLMWNDPYAKEAIMCNQQINVSKDEWNTKKGTGKSMKDALHKLRYAKMHLLG